MEPGSDAERVLVYRQVHPDLGVDPGKRFQYTEYYDLQGRITFREYYDLATDKWELHNVLHDSDPANDPDVRALHDRLAKDRKCAGTSGPAACP